MFISGDDHSKVIFKNASLSFRVAIKPNPTPWEHLLNAYENYEVFKIGDYVLNPCQGHL
jgi:hypothetical protein